MRKFKIKNRVKRKYVRKEVAQQTFSLSKSGIGIAPMLFAIVGLLTTYVIVTSPTDTIFANISIPLPHISITLPQISFPRITIPTIDYSPISAWFLHLQSVIAAVANAVILLLTSMGQSLSTTSNNALLLSVHWMQEMMFSLALFMQSAGLNSMDVLAQLSTAGMSLIGKYLVYSWQIRVDFYAGIGNQILSSYNAFIAGSLLFVMTVWQISAAKMHLMTTQLVVCYQSFIWLVITSFSLWMQAILWSKQTLALGVYWVFLTLIVITKGTIEFGNAVIDLLLLPFKLIGAYLAQTKPFWVAFGKLIEHAGNEFVLGFKNLGLATQALSGK